MSLVRMEQITKSFGAQALFAPFSSQIVPGDRIALVGDNGAGKSTLLAMIAGTEASTSGAIHCKRDLRIGHLPQVARLEETGTLWGALQQAYRPVLDLEAELRELEGCMASSDSPELLHRYDDVLHAYERAGGYTMEARIRGVLSGVGFGSDSFDVPTKHLSGGEEARAALARVLVAGPELLLLDEPTNHLDFEALDWLEETLTGFSGAILLVSHDRHLLGRVANRTWEIASGEITTYTLGYVESRDAREAARRRRRIVYEEQQEKIARYEDFVRRHHAGQKHRQAKDREKKLARIRAEEVERPLDARRITLRIDVARASGKRVLEAEALAIGYEGRLFTCPHLELQRGDRVAIIGPNGCGKTTLLKTLLGDVRPRSGEVALGHNVQPSVYSQTQEGLRGNDTALETILRRSDLSIGEARGLLGRFLFSGDDVEKRMSTLSGGERSRVALALLSMMRGNLLLLDEPTNHLDLASQEILEAALLDYEGTILLVSHDRALLEAASTRVWEVRDGALHDIATGYRELRRRTRAESDAVEKKADDTRRPAVMRASRPTASVRPDRYREAQRTEAAANLEAEVEVLERSLAGLERELREATSRGDGLAVAEIGLRHAEVAQALNEKLVAWEAICSEGA